MSGTPPLAGFADVKSIADFLGFSLGSPEPLAVGVHGYIVSHEKLEATVAEDRILEEPRGGKADTRIGARKTVEAVVVAEDLLR